MDLEKEKKLLAKHPFHIYLMVKAAKKAMDEGRAGIQDGVLVVHDTISNNSDRKCLDSIYAKKVEWQRKIPRR